MMRQNPHVCFEVDEYDGAGSWQSAIVQGVYEELDGVDAEHAVELLAARFGRTGEEASAARRHGGHEPRTVCFRIRPDEATGRSVKR